MIDPAAINFVTAAREHYAAQAFIAQLRKTIEAHKFSEQAERLLMRQDDNAVEEARFAFRDELVALWSAADAVGIDMREAGRALA